MKRTPVLPMPFVSAWDPRATASGSIDPLGALRAYTAIATTLLPGVTTITSRVRYLSWVCAGLRLLDEIPGMPSGGRDGRTRRRRILAWERLVALATGNYAMPRAIAPDDPAWHQLRGVSYVRRAVEDNTCSPNFPMLRNQAGVGGVGTYWVTLVAGGLVEDVSGALTPRGTALADAFLQHEATPDRARLHRVIKGEDIAFSKAVLADWGKVAHLGGAPKRERRLLADALLEPDAHRRMKSAMQAVKATTSDGSTFRSLSKYLRERRDPLAAVLAVACAFENLHRELLYRFNQMLASDWRRPVPLKSLQFHRGNGSLDRLADALKKILERHGTGLDRSVAKAVWDFSAAVDPAVRARNDAQAVRELIRHHERVQAGKLDASRQPKHPWVKLDENNRAVITHRYALDERPRRPDSAEFTHPYRIEQFTHMLRDAGEWEPAS